MNRTHAAAAALLLAAATALTGCADTGSAELGDPPTIPAQQWNPGSTAPTAADPVRTPARAATALPDSAAALDREDPDAVAAAAVTIWFTWDTGVDAGPNDAAARTAPLLTDDYAREITSTTAQTGPGARWLSWAERRAVLTPTLAADDEPTPPGTDEVAYRAYRVTQSVEGAPVGESIVAVVLRHRPGGWQVSRIQDK
ncbi:hypothetical protein HQO27_01695 [Rhodococcus fascians]|nr:hypothetical protein [Rhodococcus fascians]MBY4240610.1 hypothetical protein [Rhodococcus fascians]MBY4253437.1 hypothetical protein [Rhodococcus fascians]MBY4269074.1 hypothetical protein [Rhodococcus fascians]MBY4274505.1 hypothetical protein [Rhodococcus fascians]